MKIIDVDVAVGGRDSAGRSVDLEMLLGVMQTYHIDHAVCYHEHARLDPKDGNAKMAQMAAQSGGKLSVCAVLDPILGADNLPSTGTLLERLEQFQPACLRIFPADVRVPFHPFYWEEILEAANTLGLPILVDYDYPDEFLCNLPQVSAQYSNAKFIVHRQGCCQGRRIAPYLKNRDNVYFTVERALDNQQLEEFEEKYGCDQLLFGTGYPYLPHAGALGTAIYANISAENREKILCKNWEGMRK